MKIAFRSSASRGGRPSDLPIDYRLRAQVRAAARGVKSMTWLCDLASRISSATRSQQRQLLVAKRRVLGLLNSAPANEVHHDRPHSIGVEGRCAYIVTPDLS